MLTGAGLAATPAISAAGVTGLGTVAAVGSGWTSSVKVTNQVASSPTRGGGYPVPPGQTFPNPGTCRAGAFDSNHSESWIAVNPGTGGPDGSPKYAMGRDFKTSSTNRRAARTSPDRPVVRNRGG